MPSARPRRIYEKARRRYPALEFAWNSNNKLYVTGSITTSESHKSISQIRQQAKNQLAQFLADSHFTKFRQLPQSDTQFSVPVISPVIEKPVAEISSSWPLPGASAQSTVVEKPPTLSTLQAEKKAVVMPQSKRHSKGKKRGRPTFRSRQYRMQNAALRPVKRPFKQVFNLSLEKGYFDIQFKISQLVPELLTVYEEIRVVNMSVVFLTKDVSVTAGIYTAILLDQDGYGNPLKSTETWFKRVSDMPGSLVHHAVRGFRLMWRPTEPDSRNFVKVIDTNDISKTIARLYVIAQEASLSISGVLLVRGHCLCRGQYYDATKLTVAMMRNLRIAELAEEAAEAGSDVEEDYCYPSSAVGSEGPVCDERIQ